MDNQLIEKVRKLILPVFEKGDVELYSIEWRKENTDNILSILIDREAGIDLDICVEINEKISAILDKEDPINQEYMLEVASAGAEKPLTTTEQYTKAINKYILLTVHEPVKGYNELVGYLRAVDEEKITLEIKIKTRIENVVIERSNIANAMTSVKI